MKNSHIILSILKGFNECYFIGFGIDYYICDSCSDGYINRIDNYPDGWGMEITQGNLEAGCGQSGWTNGNGSNIGHIDFSY